MSALSLVPAGSLLERAYFSVPASSGYGPNFETFVAARDHAIQAWTERNRQHPQLMVDPLVTIDLRWVMRQPDGSSTDTVIERSIIPVLQVVEVLETFGLSQGERAGERARQLDATCVWDSHSSSFWVAKTVSPFVTG